MSGKKREIAKEIEQLIETPPKQLTQEQKWWLEGNRFLRHQYCLKWGVYCEHLRSMMFER